MGSWDETCALTNIAIIAGDPCVQVYFQMPAFDYYLCCAGDVTGLAPYLTRVVDVTAGDYNDYGGIEGDTTNRRENTAKDLFGPIERDVTQDRTGRLSRASLSGIWSRRPKGQKQICPVRTPKCAHWFVISLKQKLEAELPSFAPVGACPRRRSWNPMSRRTILLLKISRIRSFHSAEYCARCNTCASQFSLRRAVPSSPLMAIRPRQRT